MEINKPYLFIELNDKNFIFLIVKYDENFNYEIIDSHKAISKGVSEGRITDVNIVSQIISQYLKLIEKKNKVTIKSAIILSDQNNYDCINVSGYKNLGGSQILEEDISFILNNIKKNISENEKQKNLVHLFNSNFSLDGKCLQNLPIGIYGNFFNQHLTFFLIPENDYKNLKLSLNKSGINIEKIILKQFVSGINIINKKKLEKFFILNVKKDSSSISQFENDSFVYLQNFKFGSDIVIKDVSKVCSLSFEKVKKIIEETQFTENLGEKFLDKEYFDKNFRKISYDHINDIINARLEEIINIILKKNINLRYLDNKIFPIVILFEDSGILKSLKENLINTLKDNKLIFFPETTQDEHLTLCKNSADLFVKGWVKEAIPIIQTKKSIISRFFSSIFD